jgi:hypothetical protein
MNLLLVAGETQFEDYPIHPQLVNGRCPDIAGRVRPNVIAARPVRRILNQDHRR